MKFQLIFHTILHLRFRQVVFQVWHRVHRAKYRACAVGGVQLVPMLGWIEKPECLLDGKISFLNIEDEFLGWDDNRHGALWAYNLNYMDWLCQREISQEAGEKWIDSFIDGIADNCVGLDPYPTALRCINWVKFFSRFPEAATQCRLDSLYSQLCHLGRSLEYRLLGNHLLEDAYALFIVSTYLGIEPLQRKAEKLLKPQLEEQILPDGAHFEQSPMYHCIMLDRLLDCVNIGGKDEFVSDVLRPVVEKMLGHLDSICYADGTIPLVNDSAEGIAPTPAEIRAYARRLGIEWHPIALRECGYRKYVNNAFEALVDVGNVTASYQPGHTHADTFSFELRISGKPFIVDTGISTYNKNARRQYERSTETHNTVTIADRSSSEVWGGFRVGQRAKVRILEEHSNSITAEHDGFGKLGTHQRQFVADRDAFCIYDTITNSTPAKAYLHFAPEVEVLNCTDAEIRTLLGIVKIEGAKSVEIENCEVSREYNRLQAAKKAVIRFEKDLKITVTK